MCLPHNGQNLEMMAAEPASVCKSSLLSISHVPGLVPGTCYYGADSPLVLFNKGGLGGQSWWRRGTEKYPHKNTPSPLMTLRPRK